MPGFSVDASVHIERDDRAGVERLVRYCARPPFALQRLHALHDSRLRAAVVAIGRSAPDTYSGTPEPVGASSPAAGRGGSAGSERARTEGPPLGRNHPSRLAWALLLARI